MTVLSGNQISPSMICAHKTRCFRYAILKGVATLRYKMGFHHTTSSTSLRLGCLREVFKACSVVTTGAVIRCFDLAPNLLTFLLGNKFVFAFEKCCRALIPQKDPLDFID